MELPVRLSRQGVVKGRFQNGNLRLIQIKGEEMWKGYSKYKHQISSGVNIVYFSIEVYWIILWKIFLETNKKRRTMSGSPLPKCGGNIHGWHSCHRHSEMHFLLFVRLWLFFLTINTVSFCPWSPSSPTTPRESPDTSCVWRALSLGPQRKIAFHLSSLRQIISCFFFLSLMGIKKSPGWGES